MGELSSTYCLETAKLTDKRVQFLKEIISGVQGIKMHTWEKPFTKLIELTKELELKIIRKNQYAFAFVFFLNSLILRKRITVACTMISIALLYDSDKLTADRVFLWHHY